MKKNLKEYAQHLVWIFSYYDLYVVMIYMVAVVGIVICEMFIPIEIGKIVKELIADYNTILIRGSILNIVYCAICSVLFAIAIHMLRVKMKETPVFNIQKKALNKIFCLGIPFFEKREKENSFLIYSAIVPMVSDIITKHIPELIKNFITIIVTTVFFIKYSGSHYIIIILSMIPSIWVHKYFNKVIAEMMTKQIDKHKKSNSTIMASIAAMKEIRAFRCGEWSQCKVINDHKAYVDEKLGTLQMRYTRGMFFRLNTALGITLYFLLAIYDYSKHCLKIDTFVSSIFFCTMLIFTLNGFFFNVTETIPAFEYVKDLRKFLDLTEKNVQCTQIKEIDSLRKGIEVHIKRFSYGTENILMNIDIEINKGDKVVLVGASGSGKTTLLKLVANMYQSEDVAVLWDNVNYREINLVSLRKKIGYMFQETYMFGNSIYENIKIGNPEASDEELYNAARQSCVDSFVKEFPNGYMTCVGERGTFLSGGQIQRIAIARLILKNPDIIILDEITANLDAETEKSIMSSIFEIFHNKTIVSVSHKSTILSYFNRFFFVNNSGVREIDRDVAYDYV